MRSSLKNIQDEIHYLSHKKQQYGQFFTTTNPFEILPFIYWFEKIEDKTEIVEPFAGSGLIISHIDEIFGRQRWAKFDIEPQDSSTVRQDTILNMPKGEIAITNPPYLGKNSATRRKLFWYDDNHYDDLYKFSLDKMLSNFKYIAAIIPESFITSGQFTERLEKVISLNTIMFEDTECPVCLALFSPDKSSEFEIWQMNEFLGKNSDLERFKIKSKLDLPMKFNNKNGNIGLIAIDNTKFDSIEFILGENIDPKSIKNTSRAITRISINSPFDTISIVNKANEIIQEYRNNTHDVFMTSFKGLRIDGKYRRRLDFKTARNILNLSIERLQNETIRL